MNPHPNNIKDFSAAGLPRSSRGFSLFELVVFIISVAIIYAFAANRFAEFPAQAERANFIAITTQLQSSLNLELMNVFASGRGSMAEVFEGVNPMDLLLKPPSNYLGSFQNPDPSVLDRRSWYFDEGREELVYLVNDIGGVYFELNGVPVFTEEIRLKVRLASGEFDERTGLDIVLAERSGEVPDAARGQRVTGVVLQPVIPFFWRDSEDDREILDSALSAN